MSDMRKKIKETSWNDTDKSHVVLPLNSLLLLNARRINTIMVVSQGDLEKVGKKAWR